MEFNSKCCYLINRLFMSLIVTNRDLTPNLFGFGFEFRFTAEISVQVRVWGQIPAVVF